MTLRLKEAFRRASLLPRAVQEQLANQLIDDLEGEKRWDATLADSQELLEKMAEKAREARRKGKTRPGGFDQL